MNTVKTKALVRAMKNSEHSIKQALRREVISRTEELFRPKFVDKGCAKQCVCGNRCVL